jgi:hypothetical protein
MASKNGDKEGGDGDDDLVPFTMKESDFPPFTSVYDEKDNENCNPGFIDPGVEFYRFHSHLATKKSLRSIARSDIKSNQTREPHPMLYHFGVKSNPATYGVSLQETEIIHHYKEKSRQLFGLYKKKECERKRRYRKKKKTPITEPKFALNRCSLCEKLRPAVNIFWGNVLCDRCYFTPSRIHFIMTRIFQNVPRFEEETVAATTAAAITPPPPATPPIIEEDETTSSLNTDESSSPTTSFFPPFTSSLLSHEREEENNVVLTTPEWNYSGAIPEEGGNSDDYLPTIDFDDDIEFIHFDDSTLFPPPDE